MPTNIEKEIVKMVFDGKEFKKGVRESIQDVESLKKSFDFKNAQDALGELGKASHTDFGPMAKSLDAINGKLSATGVAASVFVSRITNAVVDGAKKMANVLVLDPIKTGLEEYETQLNAVQTILANTAKDGTSLQDVNKALDELNTYADLTIYNFTQMTDSIGKFTTAGVDLDTSVQAIKGIANVAAVSGSNAQQASTAMYQLSQAISSGVVRLQDWMSVENAGMGGQVFKDSLIETAKVHGVAVDQMIDANGSFRNSLQEGWLTSDIMLQTLEKFTGDMTDAQLQTLGYTDEQIRAIQEVAVTANDAATKIKTLTQLKDTMAEAMQSGWGQTWRIIFGDFEEAKELWGGIGEVFGTMIEGSSEARNSMLQLWKDSLGRAAAIKALYSVFEILGNVMEAVSIGFRRVFAPISGVDLANLTVKFWLFAQNMAKASENWFFPIVTIVEGVAAAFDILKMAVIAILKPLRGLGPSLSSGGSGLVDFLVHVAEAVRYFREWAIETDFFDMAVETVITKIDRLIQSVSAVVKQFMELEVIQDITRWLSSLGKEDVLSVWNGLLGVFSVLVGIFAGVAAGAKLLYDEIAKFEIVQRVAEWFNSISWGGIKSGMKGAAEGTGSFFDTLKNWTVLQKFADLVKTAFSVDQVQKFFAAAREHFGWFTDILDSVTAAMGGLGSATEKTADSAGGLGQKISVELEKALDFLITKAENIDYDKLFDRLFQILNTGVLLAIAGGIRSLAGGGWLSNALESIGFGQPEEIGKAISSMFGSVEGVMTSFQSNIKADTLQKIAVSIALLAGSIILITLVDSVKLLAATGAIAAMVALLFGASGALKAVNPQDSIKAAISIVGLSIAIGIMATALNTISGIESGQIESSLLAMTAGLTALVVGVSAMRTGSEMNVVKTVGLMLGIAGALKLLTGAISTFGNMKPGVLAQGLEGIGASLAILTASTLVLTKTAGNKATIGAASVLLQIAGALIILASSVSTFGNMDTRVLTQGMQSVMVILGGFAAFSRLLDPKGMLSASIGIVIITAAMLIMQKAVAAFGDMDWDNIVRGLVALAGAMTIIVIAANLMTGALAGAAAMLLMSVAITVLATAISVLSALTWGQLLIALAAMAGAFLVLGIAGVLMIPVVPVLIALGAAMLLMGVAAAAVGFGLAQAAIGLVAIGASAAIIAGGISLVGGAIIKLLPELGRAIAEALVNFIVVIADKTPKIVEAMNNIMLGMIQGVAEMIPEIVIVVLDMITQLLEAIASRLPDLLQAGFDILMGFLQGIADNIQEVVATALEVVVEFIKGLEQGLPDLILAAFSFILTFLNAIADAIEEYLPQIIAAGIRIGEAIIDGLVQGIKDYSIKVYDAIAKLAQEAWDRIKEFFQSKSPSRLMMKLGQWIDEGLAIGIERFAKKPADAMVEVGKSVQNGIDPLRGALESAFDYIATDYNPVIAPVLDLDNITRGVGIIDKAFAGSSVLASLTYKGSAVEGYAENGSEGKDGSSKVQYIQNNYSPEALDRAAIFRATKVHTAKLVLQE